MRRSLSAELVRSAIVWMVVAAGIGFALGSTVLHYHSGWAHSRDLRDAMDLVQSSLRWDEHGRPQVSGLRPRRELMFQLLRDDEIYQVLDAHGRVLLSSNGDATPLIDTSQGTPPVHQVLPIERAGLAMRALAEPVTGTSPGGFIVVARSQRLAETALDINAEHAAQTAVAAALLFMLIFATVVIVTVNRLLRQLRQASAAAARIAPSNLAERLPTHNIACEVAPLIESFNAALERLQAGFRRQQEFLATAAHELKTPIALMRAQVELDGTADRASLLADLDHMGRQVHQLLHLAEVSDAASMQPLETELGAIVDDAVRSLQRLARQRGVWLEVEEDAVPARVRADAGGLFILVRNLLENALHHAPSGSPVRVKMSSQSMSATDQGPGLRAEDMPLLFKRF